MYDVVDGWGDESPFDLPVFVVTSRPHPVRTVGMTSYAFVTGGIHAALARARDAAGDRAVGSGVGERDPHPLPAGLARGCRQAVVAWPGG
jgi:hypothetical protein